MLRRRALKTNLRATGDNIRSTQPNKDLDHSIELIKSNSTQELLTFLRSLNYRRMHRLWTIALKSKAPESDELLDILSKV